MTVPYIGENYWKRNEYCDDGLKENRARRKIGKLRKRKKINSSNYQQMRYSGYYSRKLEPRRALQS